MSYLINKTNGQLILTVLDGTADGPNINPGLNATDINLFGRNYPNFGEFQNENFIKLLENFANATAPASPLRGELWYDTSTNFLKVYTGTTWTPVSPTIASTTQPSTTGTTVVIGTQWWDTTNDQAYVYNGATWVLIGPQYSKLDGKSGSFPQNIYDTNGGKHTVVAVYTNGNISSIGSYDPVFTPNVTIVGFPTVGPGLTVNAAIGGQFVGTSTNSAALNSIPGTSYARKDIDETFAGNLNISGTTLQISASAVNDISLINTVNGASINMSATVSNSVRRIVTLNGITGTLQVSFAPVNSTDVTNKSYVDTNIFAAVSPLATKASPTFTGIPLAPTATIGTNTTQLATTAFVTAAVTTLAPLVSPNLTGIPSAPTASPGTNTIQIASTAFVTTAIAAQQFKYTVSTDLPSGGTNGDFWFQIQGL